MSDWKKTIDYVNTNPHHIRPVVVRYEIGNDNETISLYINYLHKAGFLQRTGRGIYRRIREIPSDFTLTKLKKFAYPKGATWQDRKRIVERYWKLHDIKNRIIG